MLLPVPFPLSGVVGASGVPQPAQQILLQMGDSVVELAAEVLVGAGRARREMRHDITVVHISEHFVAQEGMLFAGPDETRIADHWLAERVDGAGREPIGGLLVFALM